MQVTTSADGHLVATTTDGTGATMTVEACWCGDYLTDNIARILRQREVAVGHAECVTISGEDAYITHRYPVPAPQ
ncbi:hypothetical protein [Microbispora sp. NPDC049125]|uniref:hypothetical protein n=1 Tax=Microbispora sp. NPDC049125 TaxID=3154929 RepID=UPI0034668BF4